MALSCNNNRCVSALSAARSSLGGWLPAALANPVVGSLVAHGYREPKISQPCAPKFGKFERSKAFVLQNQRKEK